jgi:integrase
MPRKKKERKKRVSNHIEHHAIEMLKEDLSSPRLSPTSTMKTYMETAERFLRMFNIDGGPTDSNFRQYFIKRREQGVSEKTLRKEFYHLKRLATANNWNWPFTSRNVPEVTEEEEESFLPAFLPEKVEDLILARGKLTDGERFYLAIATTWVVRREDLARIQKRDFDGDTFTIHHSKRGKTKKHLIPDEIAEILKSYHPKKRQAEPLSLMFNRICNKAGLDDVGGYGWHAIRYCLATVINAALSKNEYSPTLLADYAGWKKSSMSQLFGGTTMAARYQRPEILFTDPYGIDKLIYEIHPFLHLWRD